MGPNSFLMNSKHSQRNRGFSKSHSPLTGNSLMEELRQQSNPLITSSFLPKMLTTQRNTPPARHIFSPARRLFGRSLRSNLPQTATTLQPRTPPGDTVVVEHAHRKLRQKPGSHVYAKPPFTSSAKAWIPGEIVGPASPRSYLIQTGTSQIKRNRAQVQLAHLRRTDHIPPYLKAAPTPLDSGAASMPAPYIPS